MSTAVIDLLPASSLVYDVAASWVSCGLARPLAWNRRVSSTDSAEPPTWQWHLIEADPTGSSDLVEMGEVLNQLGTRDELTVVVIAEFGNGEAHAETEYLHSTLAVLDRDFGPDPVRRILLLVPSRTGEGPLSAIPAGIQAQRWNEIVIASPEDAPSPRHGSELGDRPLDSVVAHVLLGLSGQWASTEGSGTDRPSDRQATDFAQARLVRQWSRVVDAGFVVDHLAAELVRVEPLHHTPPETRIAEVLQRILGNDLVRRDLDISPPQRESGMPNGLAYLRGVAGYVARHGLRVALDLLLTRIFRPIRKMIASTVDSLLRILGRPTRPPDRPTKVDLDEHEPPTLLERARRILEEIDSGGELSSPPPAVPDVWRFITTTVVAEVDARSLTVDEAVGVPRAQACLPLMTQLERRYRAPLRDMRKKAADIVEELKAEQSDLVDDGGDAARAATKQREIRRRRIRFIVRALVVIGAVVAVLFAGYVAAVTIAALLAARLVLGALLAIVQECARRYADSFPFHDDIEYREVLLEFWLSSISRYTYRVAHLSGWARVLRTLMEGVASGPPLNDNEQREFEPKFAPRSMQFATGLADTDHLRAVAEEIRTEGDGRVLFASAWNCLLGLHPEVFEHRWRHPRRGAMGKLLDVEVNGLPLVVREVGRSLVRSALATSDPDKILTGVVPWIRSRRRHGIENLAPPEAVAPLGPVGRTAVVDRPDMAVAALNQATLVLLDRDGAAVGFAAVLAGDARLIVTSSRLVGGEGPWELLGLGTVSPRTLDRQLSAIDVAAPIDGVVLGGLSAARLGRTVVTAVFADAGAAPRLATIESIADDGTFVLDTAVPLGSPIIDSGTGALVGVVVAEAPTTVAGPAVIRRLVMAGGAAAHGQHELELDPGLQIPQDVAMGTPADTTPAGGSVAWVGEKASAAEFLRGAVGPAATFLPTLVADSTMTKVDEGREAFDPVVSSLGEPSAWRVSEGRLLLCQHRTQVSNLFAIAEFNRVLTGAQSKDDNTQPDEGDRE